MHALTIVRVDFSWWALLVLPTSALVGTVVTLLGCTKHGLVHGGVLKVLRNEWRTFLALNGIDMLGASIEVILLWIISPSRTIMADLSTNSPLLFWCLLGSLGPLVSAGILGLVPETIGFRPRSGSASEDSARVSIRDLRKYLSSHLHRVLEQRDKTWHQVRHDWLMVLVRQSHREGTLDIDEFCEAIEAAVDKAKRNGQKVSLPRSWHALRREWNATPTSMRRQSKLPTSLAAAAIRADLIDDVAAACGIMLTDFNFDKNYTPRNGSVLLPGRAESLRWDPDLAEIDQFQELDDPHAG